MAPWTLVIRDNPVTSEANSIKNSFSSWDKCMQKAYCKWPVIAVIVIAAGITLLIVFCVARCLCCGAECACCCFRCCAGCCGSGRRRRDGYNKQDPLNGPVYPPAQPQPFPYNSQYQSPLQPSYQPAPSYSSAPRAQYAQFDNPSSPTHADSLPAMPTWENATSKKVEVWEEPESHEMNHLDQNGKDASTQPMLPQVDQPSPGRPSPQLPYDSFIGGNASAQTGYSQAASSQPPSYAYSAQSTGVVGAQDSHSGYRGAAPNPIQTGYGGASYGNQRKYTQNAGGYNYDTPRSPVSPIHSPGGARGYESAGNNYSPNHSYNTWSPQQQHQPQAPPYDGQALNRDVSRKAVPGSWRDI